MTLPAAAREKVRALRRMKVAATGLLVVAAIGYVLCRTLGNGRGVWGWLQAAAEASMVGGLADWFAVTALFRHPLGIPIPHTAIVPRKKDQIGDALASFVEQNFLTSAVVGQRIATAEIPRRIGEWLADPAHAARLADELGTATSGAAGFLREEELRAAVTGYIDRRLHELPLAPVLARTVDAVCDSGQHQVALTAALRGLSRFLDENRVVFRQRLEQESPEWVPAWVDDRVFARGFAAAQRFLGDVAADDGHALRKQFDRRLRDYAQELRTDPVAAEHAEQTKRHLLDHPEVHDWMSAIWLQLKAAVLSGSADPGSELRRTAASLTVQVGEALCRDAELRARVDAWIEAITRYVLERYSVEIAAIISSTVSRWDANDTGRRIEIQVGRDLQFIRINGTVVGALVGVVIYAIGRLL